MEIANYTPQSAPNPACCSNPAVMCLKCTVKALHHDALTTNLPDGSNNRPVLNWDDDDENWDYEEELLVPPTIDYEAEARQQEQSGDDEDILPPPRMF